MSALEHGQAPCPRCGTASRGPNPECGFCGGSGIVGDASCWTTPHPEHDSMRATRAITEFLRHARERDVPDVELFQLKADAFSLMADKYDEDGEAFVAEAMLCRDAAIAARLEAVKRMGVPS